MRRPHRAGPIPGRAVGRAAAVLCLAAAVAAAGCSSGPADSDGPSDDWPTAAPAALGLDSSRLAALADTVRAGRYGSVGSLLVARRGTLALERYFGGYYPDDLIPVASVTKSVASALIGLAVDGGRIPGLGTPIHTLLPRYADLFAADTAKRAIALEHVLTMRSGLAWDESWPPALEPGDDGDWLRVVLRQPLAAPPGASYRYSTGDALILSGVLQSVYGMSAESLAVRGLFGPLGISDYRWPADEGGLTPTGSGLELRPRDMAKIGQLFLGLGEFRGRRVLSEDWVRRSTAPHVTLEDGRRRGYMWWLLPADTPPADSALAGAFYAAGAGEQYVFVVPRLEMVVVVTADNLGVPFIRPLEFLTTEILPAALDRR